MPREPQDPAEPEPEPSACGDFPLIWPTTNSQELQTVVHDAFGPRMLGDTYDWHRGIDLPGNADDEGFFDPVHAAADGTIHAIGNRPSQNEGALASYSSSAGNVIVLEHLPVDLGLGSPEGETLYTIYMHVAELPLAAFPARLGPGSPQGIVDLREYFFLDGPDTDDDNRGRQRPTFKTSGAAILERPRVAQHDLLANIGDTGANYEHLHFELREGGPSQDYARNPYAFLPHLDEVRHSASLSAEGEGLRASIEITREPGELGAVTGPSQQLDVETLALQLRDADELIVDELHLEFADVGVLLADPDQPSFAYEGVALTLSPGEFGSAEPTWHLDIRFDDLAEAGLSPGAGEHWTLDVVDLCGNHFVTAL